MTIDLLINNLVNEIQNASNTDKCKKCGCMKESLLSIQKALVGTEKNTYITLLAAVENAIEKMEPPKYT